MRILVTRPEPDASRTAERLATLGHEPLIDSLLVMEPVKSAKFPEGNFDAIAVTSSNAVRAAKDLEGFDQFNAMPVYAVGAQTAEAARAAGFERIMFSQADAVALANLLRERLSAGSRVLHLAGRHRAWELSELLQHGGVEIITTVLYSMRAASSLSAETIATTSEGRLDAVLHYSPRSAAIFVTLAERAGLKGRLAGLHHFCLSQAVAQPIEAAGANASIAATPDEKALLALL